MVNAVLQGKLRCVKTHHTEFYIPACKENKTYTLMKVHTKDSSSNKKAAMHIHHSGLPEPYDSGLPEPYAWYVWVPLASPALYGKATEYFSNVYNQPLASSMRRIV